jgi:transcriptional regulator with XRE-family HTH domain
MDCLLASISSMDGNGVDTSLLGRFASYVRQAALDAGYSIDSPRGGDKTRLANDAGMSLTTLSRLLSGERMPDARYFAPLAKALKVDLQELLVQSGIVPAESLTQKPQQSVSSRPLTPDEVADSWSIHDPAGRELVRAMFEKLRNDVQPPATETDRDGSAEAQA